MHPSQLPPTFPCFSHPWPYFPRASLFLLFLIFFTFTLAFSTFRFLLPIWLTSCNLITFTPPLLFPCLTKSHLPFPSISLFLLSREMIWLLFFVIIYSNLLILHFPFSLSFISPPSHLILLLYHLHSFISSPLYLCTISPPPLFPLTNNSTTVLPPLLPPLLLLLLIYFLPPLSLSLLQGRGSRGREPAGRGHRPVLHQWLVRWDAPL